MTTEIKKYDVSNPDSVLTLASTLQDFARKQKLITVIQGRDYPGVEAWQFAGSQLGIIPVIQSIRDLSNDKEIKYEATVELHNVHTGQVVGRGFAVCSNKEGKKKTFDEYAIASMAQTRAIGKAYRSVIGWLMKSAGFEATPAEEMDYADNGNLCIPVSQVRKMIKGAKDINDLQIILDTFPELSEMSALIKEYGAKKKSFESQTA